jgi:hypothetical protein
MRQRLNQVSMKKESKPAILFDTLAATDENYDGIGYIEEADLIAIVLDVAINEYPEVQTAEQSANHNDLTLQDLETVMTQRYFHVNRIQSNHSRQTDIGGMIFTAAANLTCYRVPWLINAKIKKVTIKEANVPQKGVKSATKSDI